MSGNQEGKSPTLLVRLAPGPRDNQSHHGKTAGLS
jgi:hypothetical protein